MGGRRSAPRRAPFVRQSVISFMHNPPFVLVDVRSVNPSSVDAKPMQHLDSRSPIAFGLAAFLTATALLFRRLADGGRLG